MLAHGFWQRQFGADEDILDSTIRLNGKHHTVIGILPEGFALLRVGSDVFTTYSDVEIQLGHDRSRRNERVIARLKEGVTVDQAAQQLSLLAASLAEDYPETNADWAVRVTALRDSVLPSSRVRMAIPIMLAAAGFLLFLACFNVANLLLARASARSRESAIRCALGAGRWRMIRSSLTESALLALLGGISGSLLAHFGVELS